MDRQRHDVSRFELIEDSVQVPRIVHGPVVDRQNQVSRYIFIIGFARGVNAGLGGGASLVDVAHQHTAQACPGGDLVFPTADSQADSFDFSVLDELRHDPTHGINGDREANARADRRGNCRIDPDHAPSTVEQGAARISRIDRRVGLNDPLNRTLGHRQDFPPQSTDDSGRQRMVESERVADGQYLLPDLKIGRFSHQDRREAVFGGLDFQHHQVFIGGHADQGRVPFRPIRQHDFGGPGIFEHMVISHHVALFVPDESRAGSLRNLEHVQIKIAPSGQVRDMDDRWRRLFEDCDRAFLVLRQIAARDNRLLLRMRIVQLRSTEKWLAPAFAPQQRSDQNQQNDDEPVDPRRGQPRWSKGSIVRRHDPNPRSRPTSTRRRALANPARRS